MMKGMWMAAGLAAVVGSGAWGEQITTLTIQEQVGAGRTNEPIRMGVPLQQGVVRSRGDLGLVDAAGKAVPCQVEEVMRWPDGSLRWVHLIFQASVPAKGKTTVTLVKGPAAQVDSPTGVNVGQAGNTVTVENGVVKLVVKGKGFNLFDAAWFDPAGQFGPDTQVVKPHSGGVTAVLDGRTYRPSDDSKVEVEQEGPETAVVKVTGRLANMAVETRGTAAPAEAMPFTYTCRIHIFRNSPVVKVDFSYTNASGRQPADHVTMTDLSVALPTTLSGGTATVGGEGRTFAGKAVSITAKHSDLSELAVDGKPAGTARGKSTKPRDIGWVDLTTGGRGVAVGLRWFWQMFPKAMEVTADGMLRAGLYAREAGKPLDVYMGQARTHYLTFLFHDGAATKNLPTFYAGTQMPLRAVAPPAYYCTTTQGFGFVAESDPAIYPADVAAQMKEWDAQVLKSAEFIEKKIDNCTYGGVTMDSYGYYAWGDVYHWANTNGVTDPWNILWESNYYDYPWACAIQFARTGDLLYLDILDRHGLNLADVFMCHYHPKKELCGACRYSPPANFVGLDTDYKDPKPYVSVEFNHHKAQSILCRYYLLGDLRAKDDFMLALNNATLNPEASWRQCRGPGAKLATLYSGAILTRDPLCLDKMKGCMRGAISLKDADNPKGFSRQGSSGYFMMGIATEGMLYYWWLTKDRDTFETIKMVTDFQLSDEGWKGTSGNAACAAAFLYRQTGDEKYRTAALKLLRPHQENRPKGFGQTWRSAGYAWYYLSNVSKKD